MEERRYQVEAIDLLRNHIGAGRRAPLLVMPTGSGKTVIFSEIAKKATKKGISQVLFDRGGYLYHGKIKSFADGAREGGLIF